MGMFDDIVFQMPCPVCGSPVDGWQSKSAFRGLHKLTPSDLWKDYLAMHRHDKVAPKPFEGPNFYSNCDECGTWIEIQLSPGRIPHTRAERDKAMTETKNAGEGLREYYRRLGHERRGPVFPDAQEQPI